MVSLQKALCFSTLTLEAHASACRHPGGGDTLKGEPPKDTVLSHNFHRMPLILRTQILHGLGENSGTDRRNEILAGPA